VAVSSLNSLWFAFALMFVALCGLVFNRIFISLLVKPANNNIHILNSRGESSEVNPES
jgi:hypothetical protein